MLAQHNRVVIGGNCHKERQQDNKPKNNSNDHINQIYQVYAPYLKNQASLNKYNKYNPVGEKSSHIKNIERYYDYHNMKKKLDVNGNKKILNRKLSPIKKVVLKN